MNIVEYCLLNLKTTMSKFDIELYLLVPLLNVIVLLKTTIIFIVENLT